MFRLLIVFFLLPSLVRAQYTDGFEDGDFTAQPEWIGSSSHFVVNTMLNLQLKAPEQTGQSWLFTSSEALEEANWACSVEMQFNPSSANYCRFYLASESNNPSETDNAIFVQLGSTDDNVSLYAVENKSTRLLIKGNNYRLSRESVSVRVIVKRTGNEWELTTEIDNQRYSEGKVQYAPKFQSAWSGIACQYTSTRSTKFFFDNFEVAGLPRPDTEPPQLTWHFMKTSSILDLEWNEPVTLQPQNLKWNNLPTEIESITSIAPHRYTVLFRNLPERIENQILAIKGVTDHHQNRMRDSLLTITYTPFEADWVIMPNAKETHIHCTRPLNATSLQKLIFEVDNLPARPNHIELKEDNLIVLFWSTPFEIRKKYDLKIEGLIDSEGLSALQKNYPMGFYPLLRNDLVVTECMIDPSPSNGLSETEYVEIESRLPVFVNLGNMIWQVNNSSTKLPDKIVPPAGIVVILPVAAKANGGYGDALTLAKWPALLNANANMVLTSQDGTILDAFRFSLEKFSDGSFKDEGGWALERLDNNNFGHSESNWNYSINLSGGTPGKPNSQKKANPDVSEPFISSISVIDSVQIHLQFSEPMIFPEGALTGKWNSIDQNWSIWKPDTVFLDKLLLTLHSPMYPSEVYTWESTSITDWALNNINNRITTRLGLPMHPETGDWAINEILFHAAGEAPEFIEIYNLSDKVFQSSDLKIAVLKNDLVVKLVDIDRGSHLLFPEDYSTISSDSLRMLSHYDCSAPHWLLVCPSFPALTDDSGCVALASREGVILEKFCYDQTMHHPNLHIDNGVSLERIDPKEAASNAFNWTSSSSTAGYSTPTAQNANYKSSENKSEQQLLTDPNVFTPDGDGVDDLTLIRYHFSEPGWSGTFRVFDATGRVAMELANNFLLGLDGFLTWNGIRDDGTKASPGVYLIRAFCWNRNGQTKKLKTDVVLGVKRQM